jgi:arginyl-tRNA--protein-N-Asp/Glu arginylyltransferase
MPMYVSLIKPQKLEPIELDQFLEKGWFRLGNNLFTTSFLAFQGNLFNALWLRVNLNSFQLSKTQQSLLRKSSDFKVKIVPFEMTDEKRELFLKYRESLAFEPARQLDDILLQNDGGKVFNTYDVCVYDDTKLIACGIFDLGFLSVQGIVSFFDPDYKKYSLGKVLVLNKLFFSKENGYLWFYPGYVVPGHKRFDYKLEVSKESTEFYELTLDKWTNVKDLDLTIQPLNRMIQALQYLEDILHNFGFEEFKFKKYRFFDIGLDRGYTDYDLLTHPYIIHCFANSPLEEVVIVFNTFSGKYELLICHKMFQINMAYEPEYFSEYLIKPTKIVFSEENPLNFAFGLQSILKRNVKADVKQNN